MTYKKIWVGKKNYRHLHRYPKKQSFYLKELIPLKTKSGAL